MKKSKFLVLCLVLLAVCEDYSVCHSDYGILFFVINNSEFWQMTRL